jgi:hypothetical protein
MPLTCNVAGRRARGGDRNQSLNNVNVEVDSLLVLDYFMDTSDSCFPNE